MEETLHLHSTDHVAENLPAPKGIGMAVAFDWGLTVQLFLTPILSIILGTPTFSQRTTIGSTFSIVLSFLFSWTIAALFLVFGEGIRSGWRWTRPVQIVGNTIGFLGGFALLVQVWNGMKEGNYWPLIPACILLIVSPLIAWRLSRPETGKWFTTVTSAEARKRHGGTWVLWIALWSIVGGSLVAAGTFH